MLVILLVTACQRVTPSDDQLVLHDASLTTTRESVSSIAASEAQRTSSASLETLRTHAPMLAIRTSSTAHATAIASNAALASPAPFRNLTAIVERIHPNACTVAATPRAQPVPAIGSITSFWIDNEAQRTHERIATVLRWISPHALWYVQQGLAVTPAQLQAAVNVFEHRLYPLDVSLFGAPKEPDLSGFTRLTIVNARLQEVNGYFTAADSSPRCILPSSNQRNALYIDAAGEEIGSAAYDDTLVHELQHLIHWARHPQGDAWANEGMSVYAEYRAGYNVSQLADAFLKRPDTQLTDWSDRGGQVLAHYGAAFLFFAFLQQHYGSADIFRQLLSSSESNWAMIQAYLQHYHTTANGVFEQWTIANILDDRQVAQGMAAYRALPHPIAPTVIQPLGKNVQGNVVPYGTRYYSLSPIDRAATLRFQGATTTTLLPASAGSAIGWWSNHGDLMDTTLTRTLDLKGVTHAHLHYQLWLDIERNYDFLYVEVSTDGGHHWILIPATHTTAVNSTGNNLGVGYTGKSAATPQGTPGWWNETADLTPFAGKIIELRFEYITDEEYSGPGAAIRAIRLPALGITNGDNPGAWHAKGWLYVPNRVAARFHVTLIAEGAHTTISTLPLDVQNRGTFTLSQLPAGTRRLLVAISAFALKTTQPVPYTLSLAP